MFKQKNYLALGAVALVAVLIFSLPPRATDRLKLAIGSFFSTAAGPRRHRATTSHHCG